MSFDNAIILRDVGKAYAIYKRPQDRLLQFLFGGKREFYKKFWAVRGVSLSIKRGETLGVVGRNGSGKSTLLEIISGIHEPTTGEVRVNGRVAALLALGAGFNPDFSGRENVHLNAAVLGLSQADIAARYQSIVDFADIGEFIERPVKTYSSGMYARLAFAVAINVDPDILIVDEALAVGDEAFQRKCYARIAELKTRGVSMLFVSHAPGAILELCDRAILMDSGECILEGNPNLVIAEYQRLAYAPENAHAKTRESIVQRQPLPESAARHPETVSGSVAYYDPSLKPQSTVRYVENGASISDVCILDQDGASVNVLVRNVEYNYQFKVAFTRPAYDVRFSMLVKTVEGTELAAQWSATKGAGVPQIEAGETYLVRFPLKLPFTTGVYFCNAGLTANTATSSDLVLHRIIDAVMISVQPVQGDRADRHVDIAVRPAVVELVSRRELTIERDAEPSMTGTADA